MQKCPGHKPGHFCELKKSPPAAPVLLHTLHGGIGFLQERIHILAIKREQANTDTGADGYAWPLGGPADYTAAIGLNISLKNSTSRIILLYFPFCCPVSFSKFYGG
jgi:hypothetical protein